MAQAGVSARPGRARRVEMWLDGSEQDMFSRRAARQPAARERVAGEWPAGQRAGGDFPAGDIPSHAGAAPTRAGDAPTRAGATAGRRTVTITGRGAERYALPTHGTARSRPQRRPHERAGFRPDRAGMWAVLLCVVLLLVAATSSHAAALHAGVAHATVSRAQPVAALQPAYRSR
jgi:hypothetical protein